MKVLLIDFINNKIIDEKEIINWPKKYEDGMYYKTNEGFIPVAYCFKIKSRHHIEKCLADLTKKKKDYEQYVHDTITKSMRQHRIDQD